jgi:hypothetical protein
MYVGTTIDVVLIILNKTIITNFHGCHGASIQLTFILFDQYGYMATSCYKATKFYLYTQDGNFISTSISTQFNEYIGFDTKGHFVVISYNLIIIYS